MNNISINKARKEYFPPQLQTICIDNQISLSLDSQKTISDPGDDPIVNILNKNNNSNPFGNIV